MSRSDDACSILGRVVIVPLCGLQWAIALCVIGLENTVWRKKWDSFIKKKRMDVAGSGDCMVACCGLMVSAFVLTANWRAVVRGMRHCIGCDGQSSISYCTLRCVYGVSAVSITGAPALTCTMSASTPSCFYTNIAVPALLTRIIHSPKKKARRLQNLLAKRSGSGANGTRMQREGARCHDWDQGCGVVGSGARGPDLPRRVDPNR